MLSCGRAVTKRNSRGRPANRQDFNDPHDEDYCQACSSALIGTSKMCKTCGHKAFAGRQHSTSWSDGTKMTDSMSQADDDDDDAESDSDASDDESDDDCSSTSLSSAELAAPVYSSGGTPSTSLRHRITNKARIQKNELVSDCSLKVPSRPMMELEAGSNVWYQAYVLKESKSEIKVRFPAIEPCDEEKVEWVRKGSSRIWRGSYQASQWRHLGRGAWAPRAKPKQARSRLGRPRRKQNKRQSRACGEVSGYTDNSIQCTRTSQGLDKDAVSQQQENEIMSPVKHVKQEPKHHEQKSYLSQSINPKIAGDPCMDLNTVAADSNKDNSSKPLSSEDVLGQCKGSGVQGDQVSAKSNSSDFKGMFFESDRDEDEDDKLADTAEYDPLAKWFEMHFKALREAGTLASLPFGAPEAGVLSSGFSYDRNSKQVTGSASRSKRVLQSSREVAENQRTGEHFANDQHNTAEASGAGYEDSGRTRQQGHGMGWGDNSKQPDAAGGGPHRSRGLRELQGLSMWGWDLNDHSPRDFVEFNSNPTKRLRGHNSSHPPSSTQTTPIAGPRPSSSCPLPEPPIIHPDSSSPNLPSKAAPPTDPGPAAPPVLKPPSAPVTTISRHHSSSNSKPMAVDDPSSPPTTTTCQVPSNPSTSSPSPPSSTPKPNSQAGSLPAPNTARRQRKRAVIISDDEEDTCMPPSSAPSTAHAASISIPPACPSSNPDSVQRHAVRASANGNSLRAPSAGAVGLRNGGHAQQHSLPSKHPPMNGTRPHEAGAQQLAGAKRKASEDRILASPHQKTPGGSGKAKAFGLGAGHLAQENGFVGVSANGKPRNGLKHGLGGSASGGHDTVGAGKYSKMTTGKNGASDGNISHGNGKKLHKATGKSGLGSFNTSLHRM